jgi:hypothetical protein
LLRSELDSKIVTNRRTVPKLCNRSLAIVDNNGFVLAPLPVAPVNEADTVLLPDGLNALKRVARLTGLEIEGAYLNLDGGFDSRRNRKAIFNAGLVPNVKENPRNRKAPKHGRKRLFDAAIHSLRLCVERTFAWEDKFKRLLLRFEFKQPRHYGMKLMAYTIAVRSICEQIQLVIFYSGIANVDIW